MNWNSVTGNVRAAIGQIKSVLNRLTIHNILPFVVIALLSSLWLKSGFSYEVRNDLKIPMGNGGQPLTIAFVGSLSGEDAIIGKSLESGVRRHFDRLKELHGDLPITLKSFDDEGKPLKARVIARQLVDDKSVVAVIGHSSNKTAFAAAEVYELGHLPMITPVADDHRINDGNAWAFSMQMEDTEQGKFMALYAKQALGVKKVVILHDGELSNLAKSMRYYLDKAGAEVIEINAFTYGQETFVERLMAAKPGLVYLALDISQSVDAIVGLKDGGYRGQIMGARDIAIREFAQRFSEYALERSSPGHYTNGIIVPTTFILGIAHEKAHQENAAFYGKFKHDMPWPFVYGYDTAKLLVDAMQRLGSSKSGASTMQLRDAVRLTLRTMNTSMTGTDGLTGSIFFSEQGGLERPPLFAQFQRTALRSYLKQFSAPTLHLDHFDPKQNPGKIKVGNYAYGLSDISFTGVRLTQLADVDTLKRTFRAEFEIWFRFHGELDPADIVFANVVGNKIKIETIASHSAGLVHYKKVKVAGEFFFNQPSTDFLSHRVRLELAFRSRSLSRKQLTFALDQAAYNTDAINISLLDQMKRDKVLPEKESLLLDVARTFEVAYAERAFGDPAYNASSLPFSRLVTEIKAHQAGVSIPRLIGRILGYQLMLAVLFGALIAAAATYLTPVRMHLSKHRPLVQIGLLGVALAGAEALFYSQGANYLGFDRGGLQLLVKVFTSLRYLLAAALAQVVLNVYVWPSIHKRTKFPVPSVARALISTLIFSVAAVLIYAVVFDQTFLGVVAATGAMGVILGFALKDLILDFFAGIVLNVERPFRIGDWVRINNAKDIDGQVVEMNWRTTLLVNRQNNVIAIPNSRVSQSQITNFALPSRASKLYLHVVLPHSVPTARALEVLDRAAGKIAKTDGILSEPRSMINELLEHGVRYRVTISTDFNVIAPSAAISLLAGAVSDQLHEEGIEPAVPIQTLKVADRAFAVTAPDKLSPNGTTDRPA